MLGWVPHEFNKKGKQTLKENFLSKKNSDYPTLSTIFSREINLTNEQGKHFKQRKFFAKNNAGYSLAIQTCTIGNLVRLFRNAIAHQNITPVAEGNYWKGIIIKNYKSQAD